MDCTYSIVEVTRIGQDLTDLNFVDYDNMFYKNSSGDEIANVNFFATISHTYFQIPKKRTYFV